MPHREVRQGRSDGGHRGWRLLGVAVLGLGKPPREDAFELRLEEGEGESCG